MGRKKTRDEFIEKSNQIHNNIYDYSKVDYNNSKEKVIIICPIHGEFKQTPSDHLKGGCRKCGRLIVANKLNSNTNNFIEKSNIKHNNIYDYSKVNYINNRTKVIIICKDHGDFLQRPNDHLTGYGCMNCCKNKKKSHSDFIEQARVIHGDAYDYSLITAENFINTSIKVDIICRIHGPFKQTPQCHLRGGCLNCAYINIGLQKRKIHNDVIDAFIKIHGNKYDYSKVEYITNNDKVVIICKEHGEFLQTPHSHLSGCGCCKCGILIVTKKQTLTQEDFIEKAINIHGNLYDYSQVKYINCREQINIICKKHGIFETLPYIHLQNHHCPKCNKRYSKNSIQWLKYMEICHNKNIQHAENIREYFIPSTKYYADGYCKETNTIYEFHGSYWHGDPKLFNSNDYNKTTNCTFGKLYQNTLNKEQTIKDMGFNLITIWESDWIKLNKCVRILQKKYRNL